MKFRSILAVLALSVFGLEASALQVTRFSPQGEVAEIQQIVVQFDENAVVFGDPNAPSPVSITCDNPKVLKGAGRWNSGREWVFQLDDALPVGVSCHATINETLKSPKGNVLSGPTAYAFNTGGPALKSLLPYPGAPIAEDQRFVLQLTGDAKPASLAAHMSCKLEGLGERVPVQLITGEERDAILNTLDLQNAAHDAPLQYFVVTCQRPPPPGSNMILSYETGVESPSGLASTVATRYKLKVRSAFSASFSCERANAQSACLPIRPVTLHFSAPVSRQFAEQITLKTNDGSFRPSFQSNDNDAFVDQVIFVQTLPENSTFKIELPEGLKDDAGRPLRNAKSFPLTGSTSSIPPLAKFAAAPFGVVERFAEADTPPMLPVTLRNVEANLPVNTTRVGKVDDLNVKTDADIIRWYRKLERYHVLGEIDRKEARSEISGTLPPSLNREIDKVETRAVSLLSGEAHVNTVDLPKPLNGDKRPFEVVGIPLTPGYHVVEIGSQVLGQSLLDEGYGKHQKMYVRTGVLVTNLAVHFKLSRENALAWVTSLDKGKPVAGAVVRISDEWGKVLATATSDRDGIATFPDFGKAHTINSVSDSAYDYRRYFISARAKSSPDDQEDDLAFTWSDWDKGIEPWRFHLPTEYWTSSALRAHTVFDRSLFRAGETVSMKHFVRQEVSSGFAPSKILPPKAEIVHIGTGTTYQIPLEWHTNSEGGQSGDSSFAIPKTAKLGEYNVVLANEHHKVPAGSFQVQEFRLPVMKGSVSPVETKPLIRPKEIPTNIQINYVSGGGAANLPVQVSAMLRPVGVSFAEHEGFVFKPPRHGFEATSVDDQDSAFADTTENQQADHDLVANRIPVILDRQGAGQVKIANLPMISQPSDLLIEASYADPNGEVQTVSNTRRLWPASVIAGIKAARWVSTSSGRTAIQALALDLNGRMLAGVDLSISARLKVRTTSRKRMVGGFYAYDNRTEIKPLGKVCEGKSDGKGLFTCNIELKEVGEIEVLVTAKDKDGLVSQAAESIWVTGQGELWFGGDNSDRIDLLPEKKSYEPGETARLQVHMPFRYATALVTIEREGILDHRIVTLSGKDPTLEVKIDERWSPNIYVSALILRGRIREVPWYSFFTWGYHSPSEWWTAFRYNGKDFVAPTALVDLSKPAFRIGVAELSVGTKGNTLGVTVSSDQKTYQVRGESEVTIAVKDPIGKPAAHAEVAVAVVDEALLELKANDSWNLLNALIKERPWTVDTATAQMEIIGRRHYGRKAAAPGGGGGTTNSRELFNTLLAWHPRLKLDTDGKVKIKVRLNDSITSFRVVAIADSGLNLFGTGETSFRSIQDLQIISGLPPLIRENDQFRAQFTLRNATERAMTVKVSATATSLTIADQTIDIPAGEAKEVFWEVTAPGQAGLRQLDRIDWEVKATEMGSDTKDAIKVSQSMVPVVPLTVRQAELVQIKGSYQVDVSPPLHAIPDRGGLKLSVQPKLADGMTGIQDWFASYPYFCLEQKVSKAIGMRSTALWESVQADIPSYLDDDGLAYYFPPSAGSSRHSGSDSLTAYILAVSHEASLLGKPFTLAPDVAERMQEGLIAFVEGRIERKVWSFVPDLDVRRIAAIEALSRYGKARPDMLDSLAIVPNQWPTHAVIDWINILTRMGQIRSRDQRLTEAKAILQSRLSFVGTKLVFNSEKDDYWWWLMINGDVNAARLLLTAVDDPAWQQDIGRLVSGFIGRQQSGAWHTTTANLWGGLALEKFSAKYESEPVTGSVRAQFGQTTDQVKWDQVVPASVDDAKGVAHQRAFFGAPNGPGQLKNNTMLLPWPSRLAQPAASSSLSVEQIGTGTPWLTLQSIAAVPLKTSVNSGYIIRKTVTPSQQAVPGHYSKGDILKITLEVEASTDMTWVVINDPIPAGASILGSGLGRDSAIANTDKNTRFEYRTTFDERGFESYRGYYEFLPKGRFKVVYTVRLNTPGVFALPATRVEAMYAPEVFGEAPNPTMSIEAN